MAYVVARISGIKRRDMWLRLKHNSRECVEKPHIDKKRQICNLPIIGDGDAYYALTEDIAGCDMARGVKDGNNLVGAEGVFSFSNDWLPYDLKGDGIKGAIDYLADEKFNLWIDTMKDFLVSKNCISAVLHMDETTPHIHAVFSVKEKRKVGKRDRSGKSAYVLNYGKTWNEKDKTLSAMSRVRHNPVILKSLEEKYGRKYDPTETVMGKFQTEVWEACQKAGLDLERGKSDSIHKTAEAYRIEQFYEHEIENIKKDGEKRKKKERQKAEDKKRKELEQIEESLKQEKAKLQAEFERQKKSLNDEISDLEKQETDLGTSVESLKQQKTDLGTSVESLKQQKTDLGTSVESLKRQETNLGTSVESLKRQETDLGTSVESLKQQKTDLGTSVESLKQQETNLGTSVESLKQQETNLGTSVESLKRQETNLNATVQEKKKLVSAIQKNVGELEEDAKKYIDAMKSFGEAVGVVLKLRQTVSDFLKEVCDAFTEKFKFAQKSKSEKMRVAVISAYEESLRVKASQQKYKNNSLNNFKM